MTVLEPGVQVEGEPVDDFDVANKGYVDDHIEDHETSVTEGETGPTIGVRAGLRAAFVWWTGIGDNVSGHGYYQVQMATDSGFASIVDDVETKTNWATFDGLTTGVTYFWRVRAIDAAGNVSSWATTASDSGDQVIEDDLGDDSVSTVKIQDLAVKTAKIGDAQITTAKIKDANITTAKIGLAQITTAKIADAQITAAKIDDLAVKTAKIDDLAVQTLKIADLNVTIDKEASPVAFDRGNGFETDFGINDTFTTRATLTLDVPTWAGEAAVMCVSRATMNPDSGEDGYGYTRAVVAGAYSGSSSTLHSSILSGGSLGSIAAATSRIVSSPGSTITCGTDVKHDASGFTWSNNISANFAHTDALATFGR